MVLGGDDGNECTYSNGYLKRQAIFSCLTWTPEGNAGFCTACSLSCHEGHEVIYHLSIDERSFSKCVFNKFCGFV